VTGESLIDTVSVARERLVAVIAGVILSVIFVLVLQFSGGALKALALFPLVAVLLLLAGNFELSLAAIVVCLYVDVHISFFSSAVALSALLGVSFFVTHRDIAWKEFANPMTAPILVYGLCIVPSFLNATQPDKSLIGLWNVAAFLIVLYTTFAGLRTYADMRRIAAVYLAVTCANGLIVIAQSMMGEKRPFGPAGIMFVDYAGLGTCITIAMSAVSRGKLRMLLVLLAGVITTALILTQTRNTWISSIMTLAILAGYLMTHPDIAGLSRKRLIGAAMIAVMGVALLGTIAVSLNPRVMQRAAELTGEGTNRVDQTGLPINSLISRYFIWDTALNAFRAHPFIGIGVYAFPYASRYYSTLPKLWYSLYVEGNSPHQTHLAVLSETGVIGMAGYLVFLVAAVRCAFQSIRRASGMQGRKYGLVAAIGLTYCFVSMGFTDAWLWGQGIILLGLVMGLMLVNRRISVPEYQPPRLREQP
jgi:O-antigen ligase